MTVCRLLFLLINPALCPERRAHTLLPWGQRSPGTHKGTAGARAAAGTPRVRGQPAGALAVCPELTQLAEYRAELHKVSAE